MIQNRVAAAAQPRDLPYSPKFNTNLPRRFHSLDPASLVKRIEHGDCEAAADLYTWLKRSMTWRFLNSHLAMQRVEDQVHDAFLIILSAIRTGKLRDPNSLLGFSKVIVKRRVAIELSEEIEERASGISGPQAQSEEAVSDSNVEDLTYARQRVKVMRDALDGLNPQRREILERFYLKEQSRERICAEMGLTETQFRLLKSRAKAQAAQIAQRRMGRPLEFVPE